MRFQRVFAGVCLALAFGAPAAAQTATDERPRLLSGPSATDLNDYFPPVARAGGLSGDVRLSCVVHLDGRGDCAVLDETPADMGFGDAAVRMTANWRFAPATSNGQPVAGASREFRIRFANEEPQSIPLSDGYVVTAQRGPSANVRVDADTGNQIVVTAVRAPLPRGRPPAACPGCEPSDQPERTPLLTGDHLYPEAARGEGVPGFAIVACAVRSDGRPACGFERETPAGFGFGAAAVDVAMQVLQSPSADQTQLASILARLPVEFKFADPATGESAPAAPDPSADDAASPAPPRSSIARQFPVRALERGRSGSVLLIGTIRADRHVDCSVAEESPTGWGFADAAVAICGEFLIDEDELASGRSLVGERVFLRVAFRVVR